MLEMLEKFVSEPVRPKEALPLDHLDVSHWRDPPKYDLRERWDWFAIVSAKDDEPEAMWARNCGIHKVNNVNLYPHLSDEQLRSDALCTLVETDVSSNAAIGFGDALFAACPRERLQINTTNGKSAIIIEGLLLCRWRSNNITRILFAGNSYKVSANLSPLISSPTPVPTSLGPTSSAQDYMWIVASDNSKWARVFSNLLRTVHGVSNVTDLAHVLLQNNNKAIENNAKSPELGAQISAVLAIHREFSINRQLVVCLRSECISVDVLKALNECGIIVVAVVDGKIKSKKKSDPRRSIIQEDIQPSESTIIVNYDPLSTAKTLREILHRLPQFWTPSIY